MDSQRIYDILDRESIWTQEEQREVFHYYREHPSNELRNAIVEKNMALVYTFAEVYRPSNIPMEDITQEGMFGLIEAIERFEPDKGVKFSTYAHYWIRQAITRYVMNSERNIRIPVHIHENIYRINKTIEDYEKENYGESPSIEYLTKKLGMSEKNIQKIILYDQGTVTTSLNKVYEGADDGGQELENAIPLNYNLESEVVSNIDYEGIIEMAKSILNEREWDVLDMRFGIEKYEPMTLHCAGKLLNITRERVRQIEKRALLKLKRKRCFREFQSVL